MFQSKFQQVLFVIAGLFLGIQPINGATITYQEDSTTNFKNPERGIRDEFTKGSTLKRIYFELGNYKGNDVLPQSVFDNVTRACNDARDDGIKIIARFRYYEQNGSDAPLERILKHIEQLGPVLKANSDMIAVMEAGFIGCWGEWHHFDSKDVNNLDNTPARKAILFKLLDVLPKDRMVIIRYNNYKRQIFGTDIPLEPDSGFSGSHRARTGAQNDCFRYNAGDRGTYDQPPYTETVEFQKLYLSQDNRYVPQMGESCGSSTYSACDSAMKDLKRMRWDCLNCRHFLSQWASGGCLNKILMNFGYRIVLKTAYLPDSVRPGSAFYGAINLINKGYGKIYNPRGCELVFKNVTKGTTFKVNLGIDPRRWCTTDSAVNVSINALIPDNAEHGKYAVYLNLPDLSSRLSTRKEYSIRLANMNVWEDATGYNLLNHSVVISPNAAKTNMLQAGSARGQLRFTIAKQNGSVKFAYSAGVPRSCTFSVFTLAGTRVWGQSVRTGSSGIGTVSWAGGAPGVYLLKAAFGGDQSGSMPSEERSQLFTIQ